MNAITVTIDGGAPAARPFALMRDRVLPAQERRRADLEKMYDPVMGRPETDPVLLAAVTAPALLKAGADGYALTGPVSAPPHSASRFGSDAFAVDIPGRAAVCPAGSASEVFAFGRGNGGRVSPRAAFRYAEGWFLPVTN